jgi:hypothetical protein
MQEFNEGTKQAARTAIRKIAGTYNLDIVEIILATVDKVDKVGRTCDVTPLSGRSDTAIAGVNLMAECNDGELKIPAIGSTVGIAISTQVEPFVFSWSDLSEWYLVIGNTTIDILDGSIKFGDGVYNGLTKIDELKTALNLLQSDINALKAATGAAITVYSAALDSGASAGTFNAVVLPQINLFDIENKKILHGEI